MSFTVLSLNRLTTALCLLGAAVCFAGAPGCTRESTETRPAPEKQSATSQSTAAARESLPAIVFLGDSLTAGTGLAEQEALPAVLQEKLDAAKLPSWVINGGRSGDTTAGGAARLEWYFRDSVDFQVLIIGLGSNDAMRGLPLASIESNLRKIISAARSHAPKVSIFLWELKTFPNMGADYGSEFQALYARVAEQENVKLLPFPLQDVAGDPKLNQEDGIHPTAEGTRIVADNIFRVLEPELRKKFGTAPR